MAPRLTGRPPAAFTAARRACLLSLPLLGALGLQKVRPGRRRPANAAGLQEVRPGRRRPVNAAGPAADGPVSHCRLLPGGWEGRLASDSSGVD